MSANIVVLYHHTMWLLTGSYYDLITPKQCKKLLPVTSTILTARFTCIIILSRDDQTERYSMCFGGPSGHLFLAASLPAVRTPADAVDLNISGIKLASSGTGNVPPVTWFA
ncbi:hypothetical protein CBL_00908 [Carabus blaptoides fortunei]